MKKTTLSKNSIILIVVGAIILLTLFWFVGSRNQMVSLDEKVSESWSQVENQYQRRYDLIPNLVGTVKGYAAHEEDTFIQVTEARSNATSFKITEDVLNNPEAFQKFEQMQGDLSTALSRLMVVAEKYPDLKANENFLSLQNELEGTENRIAVERKRFNEESKKYNTYIRKFPQNFVASMFDFEKKNYFESREGSDIAPVVDFNK